MSEKKQNYNLTIGIIALLAIIVLIAVIGYFVSKPKPLIIQGEAEASEYRVSGKVPGRIEELYVTPWCSSIPPKSGRNWPRPAAP